MVNLATESTSGPLLLGIHKPTDTLLSTAPVHSNLVLNRLGLWETIIFVTQGTLTTKDVDGTWLTR